MKAVETLDEVKAIDWAFIADEIRNKISFEESHLAVKIGIGKVTMYGVM